MVCLSLSLLLWYIQSQVTLVFVQGATTYSPSTTEDEVTWDYYNYGPSTWGTSYPDYCGSSYSTQSGRVINFTTTENGFDYIDESILNTIDQQDTDFFNRWSFDDDQSDWEMTNNGHSLSLSAVASDGSYLNTRDDTVAVLTNYFPLNSDEHLEYCLNSFHMHWGVNSSYGSEHNINGDYFPFEMHFVHFSCNFSNLTGALSDVSIYNDSFVLAVVSVLFELSENGENNTFIDKIIQHVDNVQYPDETHTLSDFNVKDMLSPFSNNSNFWFYEGSLTTPPCNPIVRWSVLEERLTIGESQLQAFHQLMDHDNRTIRRNWRPTQDNINTVYQLVFNDSDNNSSDTALGSDDDTDSGNTIYIINRSKQIILLFASILFMFAGLL